MFGPPLKTAQTATPSDATSGSRPRLHPDWSLHMLGGGELVLLSDAGHWPVEGRVYPRLIPLLDGTRTLPELIAHMAGIANPGEVRAALWMLERSGRVLDAAAFEVQQPLAVAIAGAGAEDSAILTTVLSSLGIATQADGALTLVIADDFLRTELAEWAAAPAATGRPWLALKIAGDEVWAGFLIEPPLTPCWSCVQERLRLNRPAHAWLAAHGKLPARRTSPRHTAAITVALHTALLPLVRAGSAEQIERASLVTVDVATLRRQEHRVVRMPDCPGCGSTVRQFEVRRFGSEVRGPEVRRCAPTFETQNDGANHRTSNPRTVAPAPSNLEPSHLEPRHSVPAHRPVSLRSGTRAKWADGGVRAVNPRVTFARHRHHISPVTGFVSKLRHERAANGLHLYSAEHRFTNHSRISAGKGSTRAQARTSALCEALERSSGVFRGTESRYRATRRELGDAAISPNECALFSEQQFERRAEWNHLATRDGAIATRTGVPERFRDSEAIDWTPVWSMTHHTTRFLPTAYCYYGYPAEQSPWCRADSNGCAAGNSVEEAILQGFLELVERDAIAIWWYNQLTRPAVDLDTASHPFIRMMVRRCHEQQFDLRVLDLTCDLQIPVFAAIADSTSPQQAPILIGFGAHLDAETAMLRALTELNQCRAGAELGRTPAIFSDPDSAAGFLRRPSPVSQLCDEYPARWAADIAGLIGICVRRAAKAGLEVLVLDQTREDINLPVVRVVVPGLRHFWPRFGAGRLYDVPVTQGWSGCATPEHALNRTHIVI